MSGPSEKIYRYVPHHMSKKYEECGWEYSSPLGLPHACYASLYEWTGEGDPVEPEIDIQIIKKIKNDEAED